MNRYIVKQKLRSFFAFLIILILFPYIVSVFANGADARIGSGENVSYVTVRTEDADGRKQISKIKWTDYLAGILAREMPADYETEALKAQAVLIRTSLYRELENSEDKILSEDYMSTEEMETRWSKNVFEQYYKTYTDAVKATDDMVLFYKDTYAWTPFHQSSCGMTRSAEEVTGSKEYPYLKVKECPLDKEADDEIHIYTFDYDEVLRKCRDFLVAEEEEKAEEGYSFTDFEIQETDSAGYVSRLRIGQTTCTGDQFRDAMGLSSSAFSFSEKDDDLQITATGNGHGLGMSQWTANEMAKEGSTCEDILTFFFEGTVINTEIQETELL